MQEDKDYYKILEVDRHATEDEIKSAYKKLAKKYHPDINKSKDAADRFKEVNEAYYVLRDSELRKKYDKEYSHIKIRTDLDKEHCNYHLCQKRTLTIKCEYCRNFFCMKHSIPHPPFSFWERIKLGIPDNVHPCPYCPPCPHCPKKYHLEPYTNPYTTKVKPEEQEPPTKPPKPTLEQLIKRTVEILEKEFHLDHSEVKIITTINRKLPYKEIGSKIVEFISEKSISIVKRNPDSKGVVLESIDIIKKELSELSDEIFDSANILHLEKAKKNVEHIKKPSPTPEPTPPKPEKDTSKVFVSKVYDHSFNIGFNNNIRNSLHNLRKDVLKKNIVSEHEIQKILNNLIIILKNNSFEKKLDNACYKFVKKIYEVYSIDVFSYWNDIYKEAKKEPTKPPKIKSIYYVFGLVLLLLICLLFYLASATTTIQETKNVSSTKTATSLENVSNEISFSEYLNDIYASDKQKVTLNGFLERSIEGDSNSGVHVFSIVDDYKNRVILDWSYNDLKKYLSDLGKTKELYSVQGVFKREYKTLKLNVENINLYKREPAKQVEVNNVVSYTEQITINRTSPKYPLVRNLIFKLIGKEILCEDGTKINSCSNEKPLYCSINGLKEEPAKCGCPSGKRLYKNQCINEVKCSDGTYEPECSKNKPKQCVDGKLIDNPEVCGCPSWYIRRGNQCIITCDDKTISGECSSDKPRYCDNGKLVNKASLCGCLYEYVADGNECVSKYMSNPKEIKLGYILKGEHWQITYKVYGGMNNYLGDLPRSMSYSSGQAPPTSKDFIMRNLNNEKQKEFLDPLVKGIKDATSDKDDQARIAISIVQNIPYDYVGLDTGNINGKYPYEVLYTESGVCSEKAGLLTYLLKELGYGVVIFRFNVENHDSVGIKCPKQYSYINSGYCFIESTTPDIITYSDGDYIGVGKLTSTPEIIIISDGNSFDSVSEEYEDAQEYKEILGMGRVLSPYYYNRWASLVNKYGIKTSN